MNGKFIRLSDHSLGLWETKPNFVLFSLVFTFFKVRVDLTEAEHVCSVASKHGRYRQEVKMGGLTTLSVPFIIIPMKDGQYPIEVKAAVKDSSLSDGIMKMLRVVVRKTHSV